MQIVFQHQNNCRSSSKDITELHAFVLSLVDRINKKFSSGSYKPIVWVERPVSLYEKIALYSIADVAVVTATRDGMNLVPYEYIVCRQGAPVCLASAPAALPLLATLICYVVYCQGAPVCFATCTFCLAILICRVVCCQGALVCLLAATSALSLPKRCTLQKGALFICTGQSPLAQP